MLTPPPPPMKEESHRVFTTVMTGPYKDQLNAGFSKVSEIFKVHGIESLKYVQEDTPVCYCGDISTPRNELWLVVWHVGQKASWADLGQWKLPWIPDLQSPVWRSGHARLFQAHPMQFAMLSHGNSYIFYDLSKPQVRSRSFVQIHMNWQLAKFVRFSTNRNIEVRHFENVFQQNFLTNYKHSHMTNFNLTNLLRKKTNRMIEEDFNCTSVGINTDTHATLFEIRLHLESQYKVIVPINWRFSLYFKFIRVAQNKR